MVWRRERSTPFGERATHERGKQACLACRRASRQRAALNQDESAHRHSTPDRQREKGVPESSATTTLRPRGGGLVGSGDGGHLGRKRQAGSNLMNVTSGSSSSTFSPPSSTPRTRPHFNNQHTQAHTPWPEDAPPTSLSRPRASSRTRCVSARSLSSSTSFLHGARADSGLSANDLPSPFSSPARLPCSQSSSHLWSRVQGGHP